MTRHWSINGRFLTQGLTGVQRYAREIVSALDAAVHAGHPLTRDLAIDLVAPDNAADPLPLKAIRLVRKGHLQGHLWEQVILPRGLKGGLLSLGNAGPLAMRRQIVCLHDVTTQLFPQSHSRSFRAMQRIALPALGRSALAIATVSRYSASRLVEHGICGPDKLVIVPNGHEHALRWLADPVPAAREVTPRDTIVLIGTPAPHKNFKLILCLADRLREAGLRIAIVGSIDPKVYRSDASAVAPDNVSWLGRLPDTALAALLQRSLCLAFPSFEEGFGLPPLEAMALGCPVVVSDRASLPELCGDAALYASPTEPDAWLQRFLLLRNDQREWRRLSDAGRARAATFSWERSAALYLGAMQTIDQTLDRGRASRIMDLEH